MVPPSERVKKTWPKAAASTRGVKAVHSNLPMNQATPAPAPGSVRARTMSTRRLKKRSGMRTLLVRSMPARKPRRSTRAQPTMSTAVNPNWRRNERSSKPVAGGRIAPSAHGAPTRRAASPTA